MLVNHPYQVIYHIGGSDFTESRAFFFSLFLHAFCLVFFFVCRGNVHHTLHGSSVGNQPALLLALIFLYGSSVGNQPALLLAFIFFFSWQFCWLSADSAHKFMSV